MASFEDYASKYKQCLHGAPQRNSPDPFSYRGQPAAMGTRTSRRVWSVFCRHRQRPGQPGHHPDRDGRCVYCRVCPDGFGQITARQWGHMAADAKRLLMNLLDIEAPLIAAVNGPAIIHAELAVVCDIVLASERACFPGRASLSRWPGARRRRPCGLAAGVGHQPGALLSAHWPAAVGPSGAQAWGGERGRGPRATAGPSLGAGRAGCAATATQRALRQSRPYSAAQTADAGSTRLWSDARRAGSARLLAGTGPGVIGPAISPPRPAPSLENHA